MFGHYKTENRLRELEDEDIETNSQTDGYNLSQRGGEPRKQTLSLYKSNLDNLQRRSE